MVVVFYVCYFIYVKLFVFKYFKMYVSKVKKKKNLLLIIKSIVDLLMEFKIISIDFDIMCVFL